MSDLIEGDTTPPTRVHPQRTHRWGPFRLDSRVQKARPLKVLLLHGFASSPAELRPLGQFLACRGYQVMAPLLPSHGENPEVMRSCRLQDWTSAVRRSYQFLRREDSPVAVIGFCLGGTLGLLTAPELNPRALISCAAPVLNLSSQLFPQAEHDPTLYSTARWWEGGHSAQAARWRREGCHPTVAANFLESFHEAIREARSGLRSVRSPILVIHSKDDPVCASEHAQHIVDNVASDRRRLLLTDVAGHGLLLDTGRRRIFTEILDYLDNTRL